ncbi:MAG: hypothetical protein EAZ55_11920 [Cytophagales bacterium]|nr:MAG: hypothetical protein EAZ55_11920 [Cytophagales bacterium]
MVQNVPYTYRWILFLASILTLASCQKLFEYERKSLLITTDASEIQADAVLVGALISDFPRVEGDASVVQHGHCWARTTSPTVNDSLSLLGTRDSIGLYTSQLRNLTPNTTYFARAYLRVASGQIFYGNEITFTTLSDGIGDLRVSSISASQIANNTAKVQVLYTNITLGLSGKRGVCWATTPNPTVLGSRSEVAMEGGISGQKSFFYDLNNLNTNTTYYARGYFRTLRDSIIYANNQVIFRTSQ